MRSISTEPELRSGAAWIASADAVVKNEFLNSLSDGELLALPYLFEFWAHSHQLPPSGNWRNWVILGGRGAGKTRAGAEWIRMQVEGAKPLDQGSARRVALIAETYDQARDVMIFGESGLMNISPPDRKPIWEASRRRLKWPNGATAQVFSAHDPNSLRGPQFDAAWCDELAKWPKPSEAWDMMQFALRLGDHPQACITTTPQNIQILRHILAAESTVSTQAPTEANRANLAESFLNEVRARYDGTRRGKQELDGLLLDEVEGALWSEAMIAPQRIGVAPKLDRIVVAVDPPAKGGPGADLCGIVVAGVQMHGPVSNWRAFVLEDCSFAASGPTDWAKTAISAYHRWGADRLIAEVNQGGDMVETVLRHIDPLLPYQAVHATRGKSARAEPIAALYEQQKIHHVGVFDALEVQLCQMTSQGFQGAGSPDRVDALVWALTALMLQANPAANPTIRLL